MNPSPAGVLAIWHDVVPDRLDEVLRWYNHEHHAERVAVPGFLSACRYHALSEAPYLFIRYETKNVDVLTSPAYLDRLNNPTPWTLQSQPNFRNNSRTVCRVAGRAGRGKGGVVATLRLTPNDQAEALERFSWPAFAAQVMDAAGVVAAEFWVADETRSCIPSREKLLRGVADQIASIVIVIHATSEHAARAVLEKDGVAAVLADEMWSHTEIGFYQLAYALDAHEFHIES